MAKALFDTLKSCLRGKVTADEPLSRHTTWRVGGPADLFIAPADREELLLLLKLLASAKVPWIVLGAGSNLLVRDGGVRGAVIHTGALRTLRFGDGGMVEAEGGVPLMSLIRQTTHCGLAGLEAMAGIPGTVGGGVMMNAGAGGQEMADVLREVVLAGPQGDEVWGADRMQFGYRQSNIPADRIVMAATLQFRPENQDDLSAKVRASLRQRQTAQRVGAPNAGSVFKNPPGHQAWRLIDSAGLRGMTVGGAQVAEKHTNFIVNRGDATAGNILALIERLQERVRRQAGVELEPEVRIVGED